MQTRSRVTRLSRGNQPGWRALAIMQAFRPAAIWDPFIGVALNGTDVSALAHQLGVRPWGPVVNVGNANSAQQPLYTGAPAYNGSPSIEFTAATSDNLFAAAAPIIGNKPATFVTAQRFNTAAATGFMFTNTDGASGVGLGISGAGGNRDCTAFAVASRTDSAVSAAVPEVWLVRDYGDGAPPTTFLVNGSPVAISNPAANRAPAGATSRVEIGGSGVLASFANVDWLVGAIYQFALNDGPAQLVSQAIMKRVGI